MFGSKLLLGVPRVASGVLRRKYPTHCNWEGFHMGLCMFVCCILCDFHFEILQIIWTIFLFAFGQFPRLEVEAEKVEQEMFLKRFLLLLIVSDCLSVVRTFQWLQHVVFSEQWIHKLDNWDCWVLICDIMIARGGDFTIVQVKAHCKKKVMLNIRT